MFKKFLLLFFITSNLYASKDLFFSASDNVNLRYQKFIPQKTDKKTAELAIFLHGRNRFIDIYSDLYKNLNARNIKVYATDLRGHGKSQGQKCSVNNYDEYVNDLDIFIGLIQKQNPDFNDKIILITHSAGSLIAVNYLKKYGEQKIKKLIMLAPFLKMNVTYPDWLIYILAKIKALISGKHTPLDNYSINEPFEQNKLTHDKALYTQLISSNLTCGKPTPSWVLASIKAINQTKKITNIKLPINIILAEQDYVVDNKGAVSFCKKQNQCYLKYLKNSYHDLLLEQNKNTVFNLMFSSN